MGYIVKPSKEKVYRYYNLDELGYYSMEFKGYDTSIEYGEAINKIASEGYFPLIMEVGDLSLFRSKCLFSQNLKTGEITALHPILDPLVVL